MADVFTKEKRSEVMSRIRGKNTKPEYFVRSGLHRLGFRFRLHVRDLPGKPDLVLPKFQAVIFVHGCFWHKHECYLFKWPQTRAQFWQEKILRNAENDLINSSKLVSEGWRVGIIWECSVTGKNKLPQSELTKRISDWLYSNQATLEISNM